MLLEKLPPELLHTICAYCDAAIIQSLRLTCRSVRAIADEHLLNGIYACFERRSLERLAEISVSNSTIRKGIKFLVFQADWLGELTYDAWNEKRVADAHMCRLDIGWWLNHFEQGRWWAKNVSKPTAWRHKTYKSLSNFQLDLPDAGHDLKWFPPDNVTYNGWLHYRSSCSDQQKLIEEAQVRRIMCKLFKTCPSLDTIYVTDRAYVQHLGISYDVSLFSETFQRGLVMPVSNFHHSAYCFNEIMLAANEASKRFRKMSIGAVPFTLLQKPEEQLKDLYAAIFKAEDVAWQACLPEEHEHDLLVKADFVRPVLQGALRSFLTKCDNLRSMTIMLPSVFEDEDEAPKVRLSSLVGNGYWPMLNRIEFSELRGTAEEFVHFLLKHRDTLETLTFDEMFLTTGLWSECFKAIAAEKLPRLQKLTLILAFRCAESGAFLYFNPAEQAKVMPDSGDCGELAEYLKNGGEMLPLTEFIYDENSDIEQYLPGHHSDDEDISEEEIDAD